MFCPLPYYNIIKLPGFFLTISHLDSHTTTDVKPEMLLDVQTGNIIPHDEFITRHCAFGRITEKTTFSFKDY